MTVNHLADQLSADEDFTSVAALYASDHLGKSDLPLAQVLSEVIADEHAPYLATMRYRDSPACASARSGKTSGNSRAKKTARDSGSTSQYRLRPCPMWGLAR
ncbi:DUF7008 domain-containing protein [Streptomyces clavifer]|uniref:DUF7008 domain-containing protein n=1 Tax=Streptomyces clavifer TaxID=68188 RepID=UPI003F4DAEF1